MSDYKTTVRFSAEELLILRKAARDAPLTTYIRKAALRDAEREVALFDGKSVQDALEGSSGGGGGKK